MKVSIKHTPVAKIEFEFGELYDWVDDLMKMDSIVNDRRPVQFMEEDTEFLRQKIAELKDKFREVYLFLRSELEE